jgi:hypothetical protein
MTRGETRKVLRGTNGRGVIAIVIAALTIAGAFGVGALWSIGASKQSASWVSGSDSGSAEDPAAPAADPGAAPE